MVVGFCRWINVQRLEAKKHGFSYCATLFASLVRNLSGVDITNYLDCFLCIYLNPSHFDKQGQIEYLNTLVTFDMSVDLILIKCSFSEVFEARIPNGYCIILISF